MRGQTITSSMRASNSHIQSQAEDFYEHRVKSLPSVTHKPKFSLALHEQGPPNGNKLAPCDHSKETTIQ